MYCDICGRYFTRTDNLKRHKRLVHEKKKQTKEDQDKRLSNIKKDNSYKKMKLSYVPMVTINGKTAKILCLVPSTTIKPIDKEH